MQHLRFLMEPATDSMAAEFAHHAVALRFGMRLNRRADISEACAGSHLANAVPHAGVSHFHQAARLNARFADKEHAAGVAVETILDHGHVDVQDIARLEALVLPRNAVADDMIDRRANRLGERLVAGWRVVQRRRHGPLHARHVVVAARIELLRRHARDDPRGDEIKHLGREAARDAHALDLVGRLDDYGHSKKARRISKWIEGVANRCPDPAGGSAVFALCA